MTRPANAHPRLKRAATIVAAALLVVVLGLVGFVALFDFSGFIQRKATGESGREVVLGGKTSIAWGRDTRITLRDLRVGNMEGGSDTHMVKADRIEVVVRLPALLRGRLILPEVTLENPDILFEKNARGQANWDFTKNPEGKAVDALTPDSRAEIPAIGRLRIDQGRLRYIDPAKRVDIDARLATIAGTLDEKEAIRIEGKGSFDAKPFTLDFTGGSILTLHDTNEPYPLKASVAIAATKAAVEGTVMDPLQLKGLDLKLNISGNSAADIFPLLGIALPPTKPYRLAGQLGLEEGVWKFSGFSGHMGKSDLSGNLSWDTKPERPLLTADFTSNTLDFGDLAPLVGATDAKVAQAAKEDRVLPDMPLDISRLSAMDAKVRFTGKQIASGDLPLDNFFVNVDLEDRLLKLDPIKFGTARGEIAATMEINARREPVQIAGDFTFRKLSLAILFGELEKTLNASPAQGYIGGTAKLKGTGKSLRAMLGSANGNIGLGMEGGQLSNLIVELIGLDLAEAFGFIVGEDKPAKVRCAIADFAVRDGMMHSNAILIDTSDSKVKGEGTLNLKTEEMALRLKAEPKDGSILSLRTPLTVGGTLHKPSIGVEAERLAARGAAAGVLGVVFAPAALLAFVEPGLGKDGNCAGLIAEMNANTGKTPATSEIPKNP